MDAGTKEDKRTKPEGGLGQGKVVLMWGLRREPGCRVYGTRVQCRVCGNLAKSGRTIGVPGSALIVRN